MKKRLDKKLTQKREQQAVTVQPKESLKTDFFIQFQNQEYLVQSITQKVKEDCMANGLPEDDLKTLSIYLKPEDQKAYYMVNQQISGSIYL